MDPNLPLDDTRKMLQEYESATKNVHPGGYRRVTTRRIGEVSKNVLPRNSSPRTMVTATAGSERAIVGKRYIGHPFQPCLGVPAGPVVGAVQATPGLWTRICVLKLGLVVESNCCAPGLQGRQSGRFASPSFPMDFRETRQAGLELA